MLSSTVWFASMTFLCKLAYLDNPHLTGFDYLLLRSSSMGLLSILQVIYLRLNVLDIHKNSRFVLFVRCIAGGISMPTYFYGLKYIPASVGALIFNISPIIVSIIAIVFLHERFTKIKILTVLGSFFGVALFVLLSIIIIIYIQA